MKAEYLKVISVKVMGTVLICDGIPDSQGDIIDIDGVCFSDEVLVTRGFELKKVDDRLGMAKLFRLGNEIRFKFDLPTSKLPEFPLYPAINGVVREAVALDGGYRNIKKCDIISIGLFLTKNVDDRILPIRQYEII